MEYKILSTRQGTRSNNDEFILYTTVAFSITEQKIQTREIPHEGFQSKEDVIKTIELIAAEEKRRYEGSIKATEIKADIDKDELNKTKEAILDTIKPVIVEEGK